MNEWKMARSAMIGLIMIGTLFAVIGFIEEVSATTLVVDSSGGTPYQTIGQALTAATNGDTIQVNTGNGNTETNVISKRLTIIGNGETRPVVNAVGGSSDPIFDIQERDVTIDFLELNGYGTPSIAGIRSDVQTTEHDNILISDCVIHDFTSSGYGICIKRSNPLLPYPSNHVIDQCEIYNANTGIYIESLNYESYPNNIVRKCDIHDIDQNTEEAMGDGIYNMGDRNQFEDNEISYCESKGMYLFGSYKCNIYDLNSNGYLYYIHDNSVGIYLHWCIDIDIMGYDSNRLLTVSDNTEHGVIIENTDDSDLQYLDIDENNGYAVFFENSNTNTLRDSEITDNTYYVGDMLGNYVYLYESSGNIIEDNTLDSYYSSSINIVVHSDGNTIHNNVIDGYIYINGDDNTISDMDIYTMYINSGENNTVDNCDISVNGEPNTHLIDLYFAHNTTINRCDLDGVDDECTGIYIQDSKDVEISGYEYGYSYSVIQHCDLVLFVISGDISSSVYFHQYSLSDSNGAANDIELYGTISYSTTGTYNNLLGDPEEYDDVYSTWTLV